MKDIGDEISEVGTVSAGPCPHVDRVVFFFFRRIMEKPMEGFK